MKPKCDTKPNREFYCWKWTKNVISSTSLADLGSSLSTQGRSIWSTYLWGEAFDNPKCWVRSFCHKCFSGWRDSWLVPRWDSPQVIEEKVKAVRKVSERKHLCNGTRRWEHCGSKGWRRLKRACFFGIHMANDFVYEDDGEATARTTRGSNQHNILVDDKMIVRTIAEIKPGDELFLNYGYKGSNSCHCPACTTPYFHNI